MTPTRKKTGLKSTPRTKPKTGLAPGYLHGFTKTEQDRLYEQARFLENPVFRYVDFPQNSRVLEVGSGTGAQSEILLRRFPSIKLDCVDASKVQIDRAKEHLREHEKAGRVHFHVGDALKLPFKDETFDGAFVCWLLEHVSEPVGILKEIHRCLKGKGIIHINEVLNSSFYVHPYSPATLQYWFEYNDHQWNMKGDPFVGAKLGNYLLEAGFQSIETKLVTHHYDNRTPKMRAQFIEYWTELLLSGAPGLIQAGKVTPKLVETMKKELGLLKKDPSSVFIYTHVYATAKSL